MHLPLPACDFAAPALCRPARDMSNTGSLTVLYASPALGPQMYQAPVDLLRLRYFVVAPGELNPSRGRAVAHGAAAAQQ